ncbi:very short patch repair endonuclease [Bradyrhizobium diazoefficiens]|uniref:very short patch repair endonuclease n=1 Tax=Bradyrhizobium diazoefficiens TaxID=1355477 RepID=UPI000BEA65E3|nr:very short patch repair endonuclease [Bradyrhizobium diazoefficiens]
MSRNIERRDQVSPITTNRMKRTAQRDNAGERKLRSELHRRGLRFRLHRRILVGSRRTVDIAFPASKTAVFIDGCFWHGCPEHGTWPKNNREWWRAKIQGNIARDRDTDRRLVDAGWTVVRVWAHEAVETAARRIETAVMRGLRQRAKTRR